MRPDEDEPVWPVIVVGAGAAGFLAAIFAARQGARVLLLETRPTPGAKIRVSGGGRCNLLPSRVELQDFHTSGSVYAARNVLFSWPLPAVTAFFEEDLGIPLKVESTGKVFPQSDDARQVVRALLGAAAAAGVVLRTAFRVREIEPLEHGGRGDGARFQLRGDAGRRASCRNLILATGGLSLPKTGSDGAGFEFARRLGHSIVPPYPALVPLVSHDAAWKALRGVSARVHIRVERREAAAVRTLEGRTGDLLVTHRGFSGPVVLDVSRHVTASRHAPVQLTVHWSPDAIADWDAHLRQGGKRQTAQLLRPHLPRRLADHLLGLALLPAERCAAQLTRAERQRLVDVLQRYPLPVDGDEGYATAEVTGGGVPLAELRGLESRNVPGLYFCGEIVDVIGRLGGYNFLWAWVSGRKAGLDAAQAALRHQTRSKT